MGPARGGEGAGGPGERAWRQQERITGLEAAGAQQQERLQAAEGRCRGLEAEQARLAQRARGAAAEEARLEQLRADAEARQEMARRAELEARRSVPAHWTHLEEALRLVDLLLSAGQRAELVTGTLHRSRRSSARPWHRRALRLRLRAYSSLRRCLRRLADPGLEAALLAALQEP